MKENTMETMNNFPFDSQYGVGDLDDGIVFRPCDDGGLPCLGEDSSWEEICGELNGACEVFYARGRSSLQGELDAAREEAERYKETLMAERYKETLMSALSFFSQRGSFLSFASDGFQHPSWCEVNERNSGTCTCIVSELRAALSQPTVPTKKEGH
jgi:hypothetical protein